MGEFLLVTHGTAGDVLPFIRIGAALTARGHAVTLISHAPYADRARAAGLGFAAVDTAAHYEAGQRRTPDLLAAQRPHELRAYYEREGLFAQLRREVDLLAERHRPGHTVLVGRHTSALSVLVAADLLAAPAAWVAVAPVQLLVAPVAAAHVRAGLAPGIDAVRAGFGLPPVGDWGGWLRSTRAMLGLWPTWFDAAGPRAAAGVTLTGFVTGDSLTAEEWPVAGRPLLVTGGTGQLLHPRFYPVALDAVAATGRPALVVAPDRALLPARLPSDVDWHPAAAVPVGAAAGRRDPAPRRHRHRRAGPAHRHAAGHHGARRRPPRQRRPPGRVRGRPLGRGAGLDAADGRGAPGGRRGRHRLRRAGGRAARRARGRRPGPRRRHP